MSKIFISYRRQETAYICKFIYDYLAARYGPSAIFLDVDTVPLGVNFVHYFDSQIRQCPVTLVIMGPQWANLRAPNGMRRLDDPNDFVRTEVRLALQQSQPYLRGVIPLLVDGASVPNAAILPPDIQTLSQFNGLEIRPGRDFNVDMQRLYTAIEAYGIAPLPVPAATPTSVPAGYVVARPSSGPQVARWGAITAIPTASLGLIFALGTVLAAATYSSADSGGGGATLNTIFILSLLSGVVAPFVAGLRVARQSGAIQAGVFAGFTSNGIASVVILASLIVAFVLSLVTSSGQGTAPQGVSAIFFFAGLFVAGASLAAGLLMGWLGALIGAGTRPKP